MTRKKVEIKPEEYEKRIKYLKEIEPKEIINEWKYDQKWNKCFDKETIFEHVENTEYDFEKLLYEIVLWKINRRTVLSKDCKENISKFKSLDNVKKNEELFINYVNDFVDEKGIGLPMASTIIHFFSKGKLPIMDQRALRALYGLKDGPKGENPGKRYLNYCNKCSDYYSDNNLKDYGLKFEDIDKYLYQLDLKTGIKNN